MSKNLGHTHCHIKGIWMQKTWGPPTPKGPGENTGMYIFLSQDNMEICHHVLHMLPSFCHISLEISFDTSGDLLFFVVSARVFSVWISKCKQ